MQKNIRRVGVVAITVGFFALGACGLVSEEDQAAAAAAPRLTAAQIQDVVVGQTATGRNSRGVWTEYYEASGAIRGWQAGRSYDGSWSIEGDRMCFDYEGTKFDGCWAMAVSGNRIFYLKEDGSLDGTPGQLLAGNPEGL